MDELTGYLYENWTMACKVDYGLGTWYDSNDLHSIGLTFNKCKNDWDTIINDIINKYGLLKSEIEVIPDDIWTYAKYISIAPDNNSLVNWFSK